MNQEKEKGNRKENKIWMGVFPLLILFVYSCAPNPRGPGRGFWYHMMDGRMYGGIFMWLFLIVAIAAIIYFVASQTKNKYPSSSKTENEETPLEILKKRYAKGEISKEEFDRMKKDVGE